MHTSTQVDQRVLRSVGRDRVVSFSTAANLPKPPCKPLCPHWLQRMQPRAHQDLLSQHMRLFAKYVNGLTEAARNVHN